ncbi:MAG TPA: chemotaxis protein CheW [Cyclobacteriaceae bacterium]|nr:chemotaxis protein CheW [Cyclobacteriaceae bacterium]
METRKQPVQLIVFTLGDEYYGIRIEQIKEVTFTPPLSRMPKTPLYLKGIANIRGEIVAVIDLEERLGIKKQNPAPHESPSTGYTMVIDKEEDYTIGFIVQEIPHNLKIPFIDMDDTAFSEFASKFNKEFLEGIAKHNDQVIIVLNINKILSDEEAKQLFV